MKRPNKTQSKGLNLILREVELIILILVLDILDTILI